MFVLISPLKKDLIIYWKGRESEREMDLHLLVYYSPDGPKSNLTMGLVKAMNQAFCSPTWVAGPSTETIIHCLHNPP